MLATHFYLRCIFLWRVPSASSVDVLWQSAPAIRKTGIIPKIHGAAKPKQCCGHEAAPSLREDLYPQELLGSCQVKEEVFGRWREMMLLQTFQCDFGVFAAFSQGRQVGKDLFSLDGNILWIVRFSGEIYFKKSWKLYTIN